MSRLRYNRKQAVAALKSSCPQMARLIRTKGPFRLQVRKGSDLFTSLASSIAYQQLSGKAAATIYGRFEALFENNRPVASDAVNLSVQTLRSVGLSNNKALAILDLAEHACSGSLPSARTMAKLDDEAVVNSLCRVRGIGPWTVQMHLIFALGRPDVMPATDLGIQKGVQVTYQLPELPKPDVVLETTRHLAPYRSVASWYLWRAADGE
ncbi:MAG: DNA-3-methyladenine glycosylase 2 family protein [Xanthomonadales bacterium]|nr:DNA-3-methyladenine glycosylase 2 family protein [Xanthomonadales bacterium]